MAQPRGPRTRSGKSVKWNENLTQVEGDTARSDRSHQSGRHDNSVTPRESRASRVSSAHHRRHAQGSVSPGRDEHVERTNSASPAQRDSARYEDRSAHEEEEEEEEEQEQERDSDSSDDTLVSRGSWKQLEDLDDDDNEEEYWATLQRRASESHLENVDRILYGNTAAASHQAGGRLVRRLSDSHEDPSTMPSEPQRRFSDTRAMVPTDQRAMIAEPRTRSSDPKSVIVVEQRTVVLDHRTLPYDPRSRPYSGTKPLASHTSTVPTLPPVTMATYPTPRPQDGSVYLQSGGKDSPSVFQRDIFLFSPTEDTRLSVDREDSSLQKEDSFQSGTESELAGLEESDASSVGSNSAQGQRGAGGTLPQRSLQQGAPEQPLFPPQRQYLVRPKNRPLNEQSAGVPQQYQPAPQEQQKNQQTQQQQQQQTLPTHQQDQHQQQQQSSEILESFPLKPSVYERLPESSGNDPTPTTETFPKIMYSTIAGKSNLPPGSQPNSNRQVFTVNREIQTATPPVDIGVQTSTFVHPFRTPTPTPTPRQILGTSGQQGTAEPRALPLRSSGQQDESTGLTATTASSRQQVPAIPGIDSAKAGIESVNTGIDSAGQGSDSAVTAARSTAVSDNGTNQPNQSLLQQNPPPPPSHLPSHPPPLPSSLTSSLPSQSRKAQPPPRPPSPLRPWDAVQPLPPDPTAWDSVESLSGVKFHETQDAIATEIMTHRDSSRSPLTTREGLESGQTSESSTAREEESDTSRERKEQKSDTAPTSETSTAKEESDTSKERKVKNSDNLPPSKNSASKEGESDSSKETKAENGDSLPLKADSDTPKKERNGDNLQPKKPVRKGILKKSEAANTPQAKDDTSTVKKNKTAGSSPAKRQNAKPTTKEQNDDPKKLKEKNENGLDKSNEKVPPPTTSGNETEPHFDNDIQDKKRDGGSGGGGREGEEGGAIAERSPQFSKDRDLEKAGSSDKDIDATTAASGGIGGTEEGKGKTVEKGNVPQGVPPTKKRQVKEGEEKGNGDETKGGAEPQREERNTSKTLNTHATKPEKALSTAVRKEQAPTDNQHTSQRRLQQDSLPENLPSGTEKPNAKQQEISREKKQKNLDKVEFNKQDFIDNGEDVNDTTDDMRRAGKRQASSERQTKSERILRLREGSPQNKVLREATPVLQNTKGFLTDSIDFTHQQKSPNTTNQQPFEDLEEGQDVDVMRKSLRALSAKIQLHKIEAEFTELVRRRSAHAVLEGDHPPPQPLPQPQPRVKKKSIGSKIPGPLESGVSNAPRAGRASSGDRAGHNREGSGQRVSSFGSRDNVNRDFSGPDTENGSPNAEKSSRHLENRLPPVENRPQNVGNRPPNVQNRPQNMESRRPNMENRPQDMENRRQNMENRPPKDSQLDRDSGFPSHREDSGQFEDEDYDWMADVEIDEEYGGGDTYVFYIKTDDGSIVGPLRFDVESVELGLPAGASNQPRSDMDADGLRNRQTGSHGLNEFSSRSHSVLTVTIDSETQPDTEDENLYVTKRGKLSFVDLAGSEKVKDASGGFGGPGLSESNSINKSLLVLGNCISHLGDAKRRQGHIPYRDSKLTKLLSDSLAGNGITLMIACITPSSSNITETMNTLRYASRAKKIKSKPTVKMDPREKLIMNLKREIKVLRTENHYLRQQLDFPAKPKGQLQKENDEKFMKFMQEQKEKESGLYEMLQEYMVENENLRAENSEMHSTRDRIRREQQLLYRENERLMKRVEEMERVVSTNPAMWANTHAKRTDGYGQYDLTSPRGSPVGPGYHSGHKQHPAGAPVTMGSPPGSRGKVPGPMRPPHRLPDPVMRPAQRPAELVENGAMHPSNNGYVSPRAGPRQNAIHNMNEKLKREVMQLEGQIRHHQNVRSPDGPRTNGHSVR
ncbi:hypothetical protein V1264_021644 [Littorina saxatilis]|uniref:Kinesin motor domain-containing protein n=1 Tax=Littorina saxatilis TaxID=31220 RepID=A0AAN9FVX7_9CAEN